ncbi:MAG TPA: acyltransferase [Herbaspirillum sp.]|jgi:peptidoglycan/LPS O-acetylase OafA/YrhL
MKTIQKQKQKLNYIQLLRAIGAIAVVLFHAAGATTKYSLSPARSIDFLRFGANGVDLFFVISGFVIYYTNIDESAGNFMRKRLERIVPIYWVFTLSAIPAVIITAAAGTSFPWSKFVMSLGFVSFLRNDTPFLYVGWSLEYEMYFYLCVALSMALIRTRWALVCAALSGAIVLGTVIGSGEAIARFCSDPIILEFLIGILIGQAYRNKRIGWIEAASVFAAAAAIFFFGSNLKTFHAGLPAAILVIGAAWAGTRYLPKWIVMLGDASYSIYLAQVFTISMCGKLLQLLFPALNPDVFVLIATLITIFAGAMAYQFVELPMLKRLRNSRKKRTVAVGAV